MAMQVGVLREGEPTSEINTTPLIDVMLVLLVMLIITLPPQRHAIKLDTPLPCADCEPPRNSSLPLRIAIDFDGRILWNGSPVARADLPRLFLTESRRTPQPELHIAPHRLARYGDVAHVMAAAQREGLKRMSVVAGI
jgi:biopolymer transport protein ExbD